MFRRLPPLPVAARLLSNTMLLAWAPIVLGGFLLAPPARGEMLVVPYSNEGRHTVVRIIGDPSVSIISRGPIAGSLVVSGERRTIRQIISGEGAFLFAVPSQGCSGIFTA
ncbi:hypothetical protein LCM18_03210 [Qipengyuania flava]|nr:hypothetical protein LCM18_03210 [Qipengyuania flava]